MAKEIRVLKMLNGEELVVTVEQSNQDNIMVSKARALIPTQGPQGQMALALVPWLNSCVDDLIEVYRSSICGVPKNVPIELEKAYLQQTSGIQMATPGDASKILTAGR